MKREMTKDEMLAELRDIEAAQKFWRKKLNNARVRKSRLNQAIMAIDQLNLELEDEAK